ncbi:mitochondrial 54S ribosomal protein mL40 [Calcarisporiella thermophila]|uniref:mitochondrial 54S ribosomal protein mL40 n=1 Tax=Calcarisporiella thermophila TaxID=911321 RepID=UPI00374385F7
MASLTHLARRAPTFASTLRLTRPYSAQPQSKDKQSSDSRNDLIQRVLYEAPPRPTLQLSEEDLLRHDTIERAWKLVQSKRREARQMELERKFRMQREAMLELERTDERLFRGALVKDRQAVFPVQLKSATETPSPTGWNYEWKRPQVEKETGKKRS